MSVSPQIPTMGRIVIYVVEDPLYTSQPEYPAMVTRSIEDVTGEGQVPQIKCDLVVFGLLGPSPSPAVVTFMEMVPYSEESKPDTWHWPEIKKQYTYGPGSGGGVKQLPDLDKYLIKGALDDLKKTSPQTPDLTDQGKEAVQQEWLFREIFHSYDIAKKMNMQISNIAKGLGDRGYHITKFG